MKKIALQQVTLCLLNASVFVSDVNTVSVGIAVLCRHKQCYCGIMVLSATCS